MVAALTLVGAACDSESKGATATTAPATTPASDPTTGLKPIDQSALQALVDKTVAESLIPGAVVLLRTAQGEFTATAGTAKLGEHQMPDADTHYRIGSVTKTMTAAVILQLAQEASCGSTTRCRSTSPVSRTATTSPSPS